MRQLRQFRAAADAGQQQPIGATFGEQAQRGLDALRTAGEGDDAVGVWWQFSRTPQSDR